MSNVNIGTKVRALDIGKKRAAYTGVIIHSGQNGDGQEIDYSVGDDTGSVLEVTVPNGSLELAQMLLDKLKLRGYRYQPFEADGAIADPAIEIGDNITANNVPGIVMGIQTNHSRLMASTLKAPIDEEVNHEWKYEPRSERQFKRESAYTRSRLTINSDAIKAEVERASRNEGMLRATLMVQANRITAEVAQRQADSTEFRSTLQIQATEIAARVTQTGGDNSSFGWSLLSNEFGLYAGSTKVFYVNSSGAHVNGEITATSGEISGFSITTSGIQKWEGTGWEDQAGITLSATNGIRLGVKNNHYAFSVDRYGNVNIGWDTTLGDYAFKVSSTGNVTANSGSFRGNVSAKNIQYGQVGSVDYGTFSASGLTDYSIDYSKYAGGSVGYDSVAFTSTLDQVGINASNISSLSTDLADKRSISNCDFDNLYLLKEGYYHSLYADYITIGGTQRKLVFWN